jgi:hypothetical protein
MKKWFAARGVSSRMPLPLELARAFVEDPFFVVDAHDTFDQH